MYSWKQNQPKWWENRKPIKNPIKTSQGIILILNHALTLTLFGLVIAMFAR